MIKKGSLVSPKIPFEHYILPVNYAFDPIFPRGEDFVGTVKEVSESDPNLFLLEETKFFKSGEESHFNMIYWKEVDAPTAKEVTEQLSSQV